MTHVLIVESRFYEEISDHLLEGAKAALEEKGVTYDRIDVPGAFEIPCAISMAMETLRMPASMLDTSVLTSGTPHRDLLEVQRR